MPTRPQVETAPLARNKLQMIVGNEPELIRSLEAMQRDLSKTLPDASESLSEDVEAAQAAAEEALADAAAAQAAANAAQANIDAVEAVGFLVIGTSGAVPNERALAVDTKALTLTDSGAGNALTISSADLVAILPADVADTTGVFVDVAGMALLLAANATYIVEGLLTFTSAATTTGLGLGFTLPAGASISGLFLHNSSTTTTFVGSYNVTSGGVTASTPSAASAAGNMPISGRWIIKTDATAGAAQLQMRTEVAASAVTLKAGLSVLIARRIA